MAIKGFGIPRELIDVSYIEFAKSPPEEDDFDFETCGKTKNMSVNDPEGFENFVKMFGIELDDECRDYMEQVNKNKSLEN